MSWDPSSTLLQLLALTVEVITCYLISIGKSNILDAIAFTLLLRHISKKHKHLKELIYREEHEKYLENKREMFV
jgi:hypothetical protein